MCEYDEPHDLLTQPNSYLGRLVEHTGAIAAQKLKAMALKAHNERKLQKGHAWWLVRSIESVYEQSNFKVTARTIIFI